MAGRVRLLVRPEAKALLWGHLGVGVVAPAMRTSWVSDELPTAHGRVAEPISRYADEWGYANRSTERAALVGTARP